jgi:chromosome segregation ATPase
MGRFSWAIKALSDRIDELDSAIESHRGNVIHHATQCEEAQKRLDKYYAQRIGVEGAMRDLMGRDGENEHEGEGQQTPASGECEVVSELGSSNGKGGTK